jgi:predicted ATPase
LTRSESYLREVCLRRDQVPDFTRYPFALPAIANLERLAVPQPVTFLIGENGSGKSTLLEAIAVSMGFNAEGGSRNFRFGTRESHSDLHAYLRPVRGVRRPRDGYFLRAESYFNVATEIENLDSIPGAGRLPVHHRHSLADLARVSRGDDLRARTERPRVGSL